MRTPWQVKVISPYEFHVINVDTKEVRSVHKYRHHANTERDYLNKKTVTEKIGG